MFEVLTLKAENYNESNDELGIFLFRGDYGVGRLRWFQT